MSEIKDNLVNEYGIPNRPDLICNEFSNLDSLLNSIIDKLDGADSLPLNEIENQFREIERWTREVVVITDRVYSVLQEVREWGEEWVCVAEQLAIKLEEGKVDGE